MADTFYASLDGYVGRETADLDAGQTWANLKAGAGTVFNYTDNGSIVFYSETAHVTNPNWAKLFRSIFLFDTSSIPDGATITAATLSIYGKASKARNQTNEPSLNIYASTPASTSALEAADFTQIGSTPFCDTPISYTNWNDAGYNDWVLNATGLAAISKTGVSKFGVRDSVYDVGSTSPTWDGANYYLIFRDTTTESASNKPMLVVEYTTESASVGTNSRMTLLGVGR